MGETTSAQASFGAVQFHVLYRETKWRLEILALRVHENRDVMAASEYCRWLRTSGILRLLELHPQAFPLPVDGVALRKQVEDLLQECGERFRGGIVPADVKLSEVEKITQQLTILNAKVDALNSPTACSVPTTLRPVAVASP